MTAPAEDVRERIAGLAPEHVEHELPGMLRFVGASLTARVQEGESLDTGPTARLLSVVGLAIERVDGDEDRAELVRQAVDTVTDSFPKGGPDNQNAIVALSSQANQLATLAPTPERATTVLGVISDRTAEAVRRIENNPDHQAWAFMWVAGRAAELEGRRPHLPRWQRVPNLYGEAKEAAQKIEDPEKRLDRQAQIALSLAIASAAAREANPLLADKLLNMSISQIIGVVGDYEKDASSKLTAGQKSRGLLAFGNQLSQTIALQYSSSPDVTDLSPRIRLIKQTGDVFGAAVIHAQTMRPPSFLKRPRRFKQEKTDITWLDCNPHAYMVSAAGTMFEGDNFPAGERLLKIAFEMAAVEDKLSRRPRNYGRPPSRSKVLDNMEGYAKHRPHIAQGFQLFALAHRLAPQVSSRPGIQDSNAMGFLIYLRNSRPEKGLGLDEIDRGFVEFAVQRGAEDDVTNWQYSLWRLENNVNDSELQETIKAQALETNGRHNAKRRASEERKARKA